MSQLSRSFGLIALLACVGHSSAAAASDAQIVRPTGMFPTDVENVQAAVDRGGLVLLKARDAAGVPTAFNFGPTDFDNGGVVELTHDVFIRGESIGRDHTIVRGGNIPFRGFDRPVRSVIQGIHFDGPGVAAVDLAMSSGAEFSFNRVTRVAGVDVGGATEGIGFLAFGSDVTGDLIVTDNVIDGFTSDYREGILLISVAARVRILRNVVHGAHTGIAAISVSSITIDRNEIATGVAADPAFAGNSIVAAQLDPGARITITRNLVRCDDPNGAGIVLFTNARVNPITGAVIAGNHVTMSASIWAGVELSGSVTDSLVVGNRIDGSGPYALWLSPSSDPADLASRNIAVANDVTAFRPTIAHVFLDVNTRENLVVSRGTIIDRGIGNRIINRD